MSSPSCAPSDSEHELAGVRTPLPRGRPEVVRSKGVVAASRSWNSTARFGGVRCVQVIEREQRVTRTASDAPRLIADDALHPADHALRLAHLVDVQADLQEGSGYRVVRVIVMTQLGIGKGKQAQAHPIRQLCDRRAVSPARPQRQLVLKLFVFSGSGHLLSRIRLDRKR